MKTKTRTIKLDGVAPEEAKKRTLTQFVAIYPSQNAAADAIGVTTETLNRWLNKHMDPKGLSRKTLRTLGVRADRSGRIVIE